MADSIASALPFLGTLLGSSKEGGIYVQPGESMEFLKAAQRDVIRKLRSRGVTSLRFQGTVNVAASSTTATLTSLSNFLVPLEIWEKPQGAADAQYAKMQQLDELPDVDAAGTIGAWKWYGQQLHLLPCTAATTIRIDYVGRATDPTLPSDVLLLADSLDAVTFTAAHLICLAAGKPTQAERWETKAAQAIRETHNTDVRHRQRVPVRRRHFRAPD